MRVRKKLSREEDTIIEAYVVHNRTMRELAMFHNVAVGTIKNILDRNGVPTRSRGRKRLDKTDLEIYKKIVSENTGKEFLNASN